MLVYHIVDGEEQLDRSQFSPAEGFNCDEKEWHEELDPDGAR